MNYGIIIGILAFWVGICSANHSYTEQFDNIIQKCSNQNKIKADQIKIHDPLPFHVVVSEDMKCAAKCIVSEILDVDTKVVNVERAVDVVATPGFEADRVRKNVKVCEQHITPVVDCNTAWNFYNCMHQ